MCKKSFHYGLEETRSLVVFSYLKEHKLEAEIELASILVANGHYFNYLVSKILLKRGENFVISPHYFASWSDEKKNVISKYFFSAMRNSDNDEESENFYLF